MQRARHRLGNTPPQWDSAEKAAKPIDKVGEQPVARDAWPQIGVFCVLLSAAIYTCTRSLKIHTTAGPTHTHTGVKKPKVGVCKTKGRDAMMTDGALAELAAR